MLLDQAGDAAQHLAARGLGHGGPRPLVEGAPGRLAGAVDVLGVALGDQRPRLAGVGIVRLELLAGGGLAPLAVDVGLVLLELGRPVLHGGTPRRSVMRCDLAPRLVRDGRPFKRGSGARLTCTAPSELPSEPAMWKIAAKQGRRAASGRATSGARRVSHWRRHRRDVHRLCAVRCAWEPDVRAQAADHAARSLRGGHRRRRGAAGPRARRHRRCQRCRAWHDAGHQCGDRAQRRRHRHAGDGGLQRHSRYGLRAPLRPVRPARQVSAAAGAAPVAHRGAGARALRRQRRAAPRRSGRQGCRAPLPRARRCRRRRLLPSRLCQSGAREARRGDSPGSGARPVRLSLGRRVPQHARVRALDDDDRQRLHPADVRPLSGTAGERPGRPGLPRPSLHHGLQRRHADRRHRPALPGARARVRGRPRAR